MQPSSRIWGNGWCSRCFKARGCVNITNGKKRQNPTSTGITFVMEEASLIAEARLPGCPRPRTLTGSRKKLRQFSASVPPGTLHAIDDTRSKVNAAEHKEELFIIEGNYRFFAKNILAFGERLAEQKAFTLLTRSVAPRPLFPKLKQTVRKLKCK